MTLNSLSSRQNVFLLERPKLRVYISTMSGGREGRRGRGKDTGEGRVGAGEVGFPTQ